MESGTVSCGHFDVDSQFEGKDYGKLIFLNLKLGVWSFDDG